MILLYRLLFIPALLLALPAYAPRMIRRGGYLGHFRHRFGIWRGLLPKAPDIRRIWIHAVSVGELLALKPLIRRLRDHDPRNEIILTTTTSTAYALAEGQLLQYLAFLAYFPLDFWIFSSTAWKRAQPDICILMEAEIWPEHLHQARLRNVPVFLVNARMSERSFHRWKKMPDSVRSLFTMLHTIVAASEEDRRRFIHLGAAEDRVAVSGNLKLDFMPAPILDLAQAKSLLEELGLSDPHETAAPLILAGASTWSGEEEILLRILQQMRKQGLSCRLLLVPRHAERGRQLREVLSASGFKAHFRTDGMAPGVVDAAVADTTGEMVRLLQIADIVFVGKSMEPHRGGQNPIEAAALGKAVVFGPNMDNFQAVARSMLENGAACQVRDEEELLVQVSRLMHDPAARQKQGRAASTWHAAGRGATEKTFAVLRATLSGSATG